MDFDLDRITVPFRMQPGLRRLAPGARHLTPLDPASALYREKAAVFARGASRHAVTGFDAAPALAALRAQATAEGVPFDGPPELGFEQDLAVLDGATGTLPWLCVCVPTHWAPEVKLGKSFAEVHAPVADAAAVIAASNALVALATGGEAWEREVWTITPSARYDQHPARHPRAPWPDASDLRAFARRCFLRVERQTFLPVGRGTAQALFTIRVMLAPLAQAVDTPAKAQRLAASLSSMSPAVLAYKGLAGARDPLLRWLASCTG